MATTLRPKPRTPSLSGKLLATVPFLFVAGQAGAFVKPMIQAYALAVLASMVVAATLAPALFLLLYTGIAALQWDRLSVRDKVMQIGLSTGGVISGTPSGSGTTFTAQVTDGVQTATKSLTITNTGVLTITTATPMPSGAIRPE